MPDLKDIREYMRRMAEDDRSRRSVRVFGATLEEALSQATIELGVPLRKIEYEILEKGSPGYLGIGKKDMVLLAYEHLTEEESFDQGQNFDVDLGFAEDVQEIDLDGEALVRLTHEGVLLKVTPPQGVGRKLTEKMAFEALASRNVKNFDKNMVSTVVKQADGEYIRVGDYDHNPVNDALMTVDIADMEMKAYITLNPPGPGGADVTGDTIVGFLKGNGILHGIIEDKVTEMEDHPVYGQPVLIAQGTAPVPGRDAKILFNFDKDRTAVNLKEKNGRVDFKELNLIQNVVEGQVLAKKVPPDDGTPGRTVLGRLVPTRPGSDVKFELGRNVRLSDDKLSLLAEINGQVMVSGEKVNVEPVYMVNGDVNLKSGGNVIFLGTVFVKGSVEDGFKVKAAGNIEIIGNVGKCELDAEGDIIVHQGINGKGEGQVRAGRSVWAKFIENSRVEAAENVVASDGIINSQVEANKKVICQGKRATIVGGHIRASEEVRAKTLGSLSGSETIVEVGYDPKSVARMAAIDESLTSLQEELDECERNIATLENFKKVRNKELPEDKAAFLEELLDKRKDLQKEKGKLEGEQQELKDYLASLKIVGKISAASRVYAGVKVVIKDASLKIRNEFRATTFINEANNIKSTKYEESSEDYSRKE